MYMMVNDETDTEMARRNHKNMQDLREAAKPLIEFVNTHCCPHDIVLIEQGFVRLYQGSLGFPTEVPD